MRRYYFLFVSILIIWNSYCFAQQHSNLVIDAPGNEQFVVLVNGYHLNHILGARVEIRGLPESTYKVQILFDDATINSVEEDIRLPAKVEMVYSLEYFSTNNETSFKDYELKFATTRALPSNHIFDADLIDGFLEENTLYIHGPNSPEPNTRSISISYESNEVVVKDKPTEYPIEVKTQLVIYKKTIIGSNCPSTVSDKTYNDVMVVLENQPNEDEKLYVTKKVISNFQNNNYCFKADQLKSILKLFSSDTTRLIVAKVTKELVSDPNNYSILQEAFDDASLFIP